MVDLSHVHKLEYYKIIVHVSVIV